MEKKIDISGRMFQALHAFTIAHPGLNDAVFTLGADAYAEAASYISHSEAPPKPDHLVAVTMFSFSGKPILLDDKLAKDVIQVVLANDLREEQKAKILGDE